MNTEKQFTFSPSNLKRCEAAFMLEQDDAMGKQPALFARNVRAKAAWEEL